MGLLGIWFQHGTASGQTALRIVSTNFIGGSGDQRGTAISIANSAAYVTVVNAQNQNSGDATTVAKFALPIGASPAWSRTFGSGSVLFGVAAGTDGVYGGGWSYTLTSDPAGGKEVKAVMAKFPLDGSNGAGPENTIWVAGSGGTNSRANFFSYGGVEYGNGATVATENGLPAVYLAAGGQPCSYGAYFVAKFDANGNKIAAATDSSVGISFGVCSIPSGGGGSGANAVTPVGTNIVFAGNTGWAVDGDNPNSRPVLWFYNTNLTLVNRFRDTGTTGTLQAVTFSGGYIYAAGATFIPGNSVGSDFLVQQWSTNGTRLWSKSWGGGDNDQLNGIVAVGNRLFAAGYTRSSGAGGADVVIFEINPANGAILSTNLFGGAQDDMANGVATDGTDLYVIGETKSFVTNGNTLGQNEAFILRYSLSNTVALSSISVTPANAGIGVTSNLQFTATGTFSDGSSRALTSGGNSWANGIAIPQASYGLGGAFVGGKFYAVSGFATTRVGIYDPTNNTWSSAAALPQLLQYFGIADLNGKIYVAGGDTGGGGDRATLYRYDPALNTWTNLPAMPLGARYGVRAAALDGKIYVVGGYSLTSSTYLNRVEIYDPASNSWTTGTSLPAPRSQPMMGTVNGKLYVAGGSDAGGALTNGLVFDPGSNTWTTIAPPPMSGYGSVVLGGKLYGVSVGPSQNQLQAYNPASNTWSTNFASMTTGFHDGVAADETAQKIFGVGGWNGNYVSALEIFSAPGEVIWTATPTNIVSINLTGLATGTTTGLCAIVATAGSIIGSTALTVTNSSSSGTSTNTTPTVVGFVSIGSQAAAQMAVNPNTDRIYIAGGYAQSPLTVINASSKTSPVFVTTVSGSGGVAVSPALNRFYASGGFGGTLLTFDGANNSQINSVSIGYCGGQLDFDPIRNLIFMTSQCGGGNDPLHVFDAIAGTLSAGPLGSGGVVSFVRVNPATGRSYVYRSGATRVFGAPPTYSFITDLTNPLAGVNPISNLLYFQSGSDLQVLDGNSHALVTTITGAGSSAVAVNTNRNRIYSSDGSSLIRIISGTTHTVTGSFSLGTGVVPSSVMAVDAAKNRLYVIGTSNSVNYLYIVDDGSNVALAITSTTLPAGVVNQAYAASLSASGGTAPYSWSLASGTLPTGLAVNTNGALQGTPTTAATFNFSIRATDSLSQSATQSFSVTIAQQAALQLTSTNFFGGSGDQRALAISITNGAAFVAGTTDANGVDGLAARYNLPLASATSPAWTLSWPSATGGDEFNGIAAAGDAIYVAGDSYSRTSDSVGGKENKGIVVRFPLTGATGGGFGGSTWDKQTPPGSAFSYGGGEALLASLVLSESGTNNIYVTGSGQQNGANGGRLYITKVNTNGTVLWTRDDSASMVNNAYSLGRALASFNGNIYVAGINTDSGNKAYLRKYDSNGTLLWSRTTTSGSYVGVTAFGGFIFAVGSVGSGTNANAIVDKWDEAGNLVWSQTFDRASSEDALNGVIGLGSRLYAAGYTRGNTAGGADVLLLELDPATGGLISTTLYGGTADDMANGIATDGTDLYVVGESRSFGTGNEVMLLRYSLSQQALPLSITTQILPSGEVNQPYSSLLQGAGGTLPYTWGSVSNLALPAGLALTTNGLVSGTPTNSGSFTFGIRLTDAAAQSVTQLVSLTINAVVTAPVQLIATNILSSAVDQRGMGVAWLNGQIVIAGTIASNGQDGFVASFNSVTNTPAWMIAWPRSSGADEFYSVALSSEGAYVAGQSYSRTTDTLGGKENKGIVVKFPLSGAGGGGFNGAIWDKQVPATPGAFSYGGGENLNAVTVATENNAPVAYVTGSAQSGYANGGRLFVSKVRADSTIAWTATDGVATPFSVGCAITTLNGNVYAAGVNTDSGSSKAYLRKLDSSGTAIWTRSSSAGEIFYGITGAGQSIFAVGATVSSGSSANFLIERYDESGNLLWSQQYDRNGAEDILRSVVVLGSRLYAVGSTRGTTAGGADAILLEINPATGDLLSSTLFGGSQDDIANGIATDGSTLFVVGETRSFGGINRPMLLQYAVNQPSASLSIVTAALPAGQVGQPYFSALAVFGGTAPYSWSLATNSAPLPGGLNLSTNGVLQGTPGVTSSIPNLIVQVTDSAFVRATAQKMFALNVIPTNSLPSVSITSPGNGASFIAPANITITASATDSDGTIAKVDFYDGASLVGTASGSPYSLTLSNKQAGSYSLRAVAVDNLGGSNNSSTVVITVNATVATVTINFDPLTQSPSSGFDGTLSNYLAGFGIIASNVSSGTRLNVINQNSFYGGGVVTASSPNNVFTQVGSNDPVSYTLTFGTPLNSFGLTRVALIAGPSGITHPWWRMHAYDSNGVELAAVGEELIASYSNVAAKAFNLIAPAGSLIASVRIESDNRHFAAFNTGLFDDFILATSVASNIPPVVSISSPTNSATFAAGTNILITAAASDSDGIQKVDIYLGTSALIATLTNAPYTITLSNVAAGFYSVRAVATDNLGATRSSASINITVTSSLATTLINFDSINAVSGNVSGTSLSNYFGGYGISVTNLTFGTRLEVANGANVYGGKAVVASSPNNLLTQVGLNEPVKFTVSFSQPLQSFGFTRPKLLAGSSGITHPQWSAHALDAAGVELASTGESLISAFSDVASRTFVLNGPGIKSVRFESDGAGFAAFSAVLLDDFVLNSSAALFPPTLTVTTPANGASFSAPAIVAVNSTASSSNGIHHVEFYLGNALAGSVTNSPYNFTLTNLAAANYVLLVRAIDNFGLASNVTVNFTVTATSSSQTINFDTLDATAAEVGGLALTNYFAGYGISISNLTAGTRLIVVNDANIYAGQAANASSRSNLLTQAGSNDPVLYQLYFNQVLQSFRFSRAKLIAGPSGITHPYWKVRAYDSGGNDIGSIEEGLIASYSDVPAKIFTLNGPGIASISVYSENRHFAAFSAALLDDFVLTTSVISNQPPTVTISNPTNNATFAGPTNITLNASALDADGSIARVDYFFGTNVLIGSATTGPLFALTWSNVTAGNYLLTAVATDNLGAARLSSPINVFVTSSVTNAPAILTQPQGQIITTSNSAIFSVTVNGAGPLAYQWRLNGVNIPSATNSSFSVTNARPTDSGTYNVVVANPGGAASSDLANLIVLPADNATQNSSNDNFAGRIAINPLFGPTIANNINATKEPGEPNHAGKPGGKSVWFTWRATFTGAMALTTRGSGFDTVLAVYTNSSSPPSIANLVLVASDDDSGGDLNSLVVFNCIEGVDYQIALDGIARGNGNIVLGLPAGGYRVLNSSGVAESVPLIVAAPQSQTVPAGALVPLNVGVISPTTVRYQWFVNGAPISGATNSSFNITNTQPVNVGQYSVLVVNDAGSIRSRLASVEIGTGSNVNSEDKFSDLFPGGGPPPGPQSVTPRQDAYITVTAGTLGTQLLCNFGSTTENGEFNHGGVLGGASRWFVLRPSVSGTILIDTIGSDIDTVLAVYSGNDFSNLVYLAGDDNGAPDHIRSLVRLNVTGGTDYSVAVDGKNGAQGNITLNWRLGTMPTFIQPPQSQTVEAGSTVTFGVGPGGLPAPTLQWRFNATNIFGATNATLSLTNVQAGNIGNYSVVASNFVGTITSPPASLTVTQPLLPPNKTKFTNGVFQFQFIGQLGQPYVVEGSTNLINWIGLTNFNSSSGAVDFIDMASSNLNRRFYRARPGP